MVSGAPVPPDLIYYVKRSFHSSFHSTLSSTHFPLYSINWGCFEMGLGRKSDPEPGRCRRTDGKKWRCSKGAFRHSKYCERHMHRGRNRSRKPVEVTSTTTTPTMDFSTSTLKTSFSSSSSPPGSVSESHIPKPLFLYSVPNSQSGKDYNRSGHATREGWDERTFIPQASKTARSLTDPFQPLKLGSYKGCLHLQPHFRSVSHGLKEQQQPQKQHSFVLGTDFRSSKPDKTEKQVESQKPLHHFLEEYPPKNTKNWLDLTSNSNISNGDFFKLSVFLVILTLLAGQMFNLLIMMF